MRIDSADWIAKFIMALILILVFGFGIYAFQRNWAECRATPHTVFYCLTAGDK